MIGWENILGALEEVDGGDGGYEFKLGADWMEYWMDFRGARLGRWEIMVL